MDENNFRVFLLINKDRIVICVKSNLKHKVIYKDYILVNENPDILDFKVVESFLDNQIITIEKSLNKFVNKIYIILASDEFLDINLSIKKENHKSFLEKENVNSLINDAKNQFLSTTENMKLIHVIVDNYIIEEKRYQTFPDRIRCDNFCITLKIVCIKRDFLKDLEKILERYQVSISRIISYNYLKSQNS